MHPAKMDNVGLPKGIDPITFELIKNGLASIADDMSVAHARAAYSTVVKDMLDFSTAVCAPDGTVVAQGLCLALQLGAIPTAMKGFLAEVKGRFAPGDVWILNHPYQGGVHLPDIFMFRPAFLEDELIGFLAIVSHAVDIGGRVPGSIAVDSTELFQEGLILPPVKLVDRGEMNQTLLSIIGANVRIPDKVLGDLRAQIAGCQVGEQRLQALARRHGTAALLKYMRELTNYSERLLRAQLATWPDGVVEGEAWIDDDGLGSGPLRVSVNVTKKGDSITIDFNGTDRQARSAINASFPDVISASNFVVRALLDVDVPMNAGFYRVVKVDAPKGTLVNPEFPAAVASRALVIYRMCDAIFAALGKLMPERVLAQDGGPSQCIVAGSAVSGERYVFLDYVQSGWGARPTADGLEGVSHPISNAANVPVEVIESQYPIRITRYGLEEDTGGPGRFRGSLAIVREYTLLADSAILQYRLDRTRFCPQGVVGGHAGTPASAVLNPGPGQTVLPPKSVQTFKRGEAFRMTLASGGGHGDPLTRDPWNVLDDVLDGKVSLQKAREIYGVVIRGDSMAVDQDETNRVRRRMAAHGTQGSAVIDRNSRRELR